MKGTKEQKKKIKDNKTCQVKEKGKTTKKKMYVSEHDNCVSGSWQINGH